MQLPHTPQSHKIGRCDKVFPGLRWFLCAREREREIMSELSDRISEEDLERLGVPADFADPLDLIFKCVSDNGSNMVAAWNDGDRWVPCFDHTLELATLPVTWIVKKKNGELGSIPKGSVAEAFARARALVGYLHVSAKATDDLHKAQRKCGLPERTIDQDVRTRWRSAHDMARQLVSNKAAIFEMDKNPSYKVPGETWGKNKLEMLHWDYLEEGAAILERAADASQFMEGDQYVTSSLVVPYAYKLMYTSVSSADVKFSNRAADPYNDSVMNPTKVPHADLTDNIRTNREKLHEAFITRFDSDVSLDVKKFWFIAAMCDPRYKKLQFRHDNLLKDNVRKRAEQWFSAEFNAKYRGRIAPTDPTDTASATATPVPQPSLAHANKRRKVSSAQAFMNSSEEEQSDDEDSPAAPMDELKAYLALPQVKIMTEQDMLQWWQENEGEYPNLAVMARQYLGCPATSAAVERLFSKVGIAFSKKAKSSQASTLAAKMFTHNL